MNHAPSAGGPNRTLADLQADVESTFVLLDLARAGDGRAPMTPRVSVCIPAYNYARYLPAAIDSVLAQEYGDYELIVVDNASEDETPAVLARYGDRIRAERNERNVGLFGNFARCLELAPRPPHAWDGVYRAAEK